MRRLTVFFLILLLSLSACEKSPTASEPDLEPPGDPELVTRALSSAGGADDLLVNGGMETNEGWFFHGPATHSRGYSTDLARSGARSIKLSAPEVAPERGFDFAGQYSPVEDPSGRKFTLTVHMKLEDVSGEGVAVALRGDSERPPSGSGEAFATTQNKRVFVGTTDWIEVSVELQYLESNIQTITAYLILLPGTTGTAYFDDVELHISEWTPVLSLQNGGFEVGQDRPESWWHGGPGYGNFLFGWIGVESWQGDRAVSISRYQRSEDEFSFWAQTIYAEDFLGGSATLKVRVKTDLEGQGVSIVIRGDDTMRPSGYAEAFASTQGRVPISGRLDWTEYSLTLDHIPGRMKSLTVYLVYLPGTTGIASFDGVSLMQ